MKAKRLVRHLSFANVVACIALFVALGGSAYAATKINGNSIKNASIGGGKLKNATVGAGKLKDGTITSKQIAAGTLTGTDINVTTLGTVPSAQAAATASSATNATHATNADHATTAGSAASATSADSATTAKTATEADHAATADTAGDADTVNGETAADLTLSCPAGTEPYGGVCWDETQRPIRIWIVASKECGDAGGRLPNLSELIAYVTREGLQATGQNWSSDVADFEGGDEKVMTSDDTTREVKAGATTTLGFRCVFYPSN